LFSPSLILVDVLSESPYFDLCVDACSWVRNVKKSDEDIQVYFLVNMLFFVSSSTYAIHYRIIFEVHEIDG
jgi:hypothetical protein